MWGLLHHAMVPVRRSQTLVNGIGNIGLMNYDNNIHLYRTNLEEIHNIIPINLSTEINSTYQE